MRAKHEKLVAAVSIAAKIALDRQSL